MSELRNGRFVLLELLGEGAQGRTYDGVDKREGKPVAIKRFDVRGAKSWKDVELAEREAKVLRALSHPKLPAYVDHFEDDGALYLVMEKIEGESLASLRKRGEVLGEDDILRLLRDASEVLEYLHGRAPPVVHRDLKPGNVIRRPDGSFAFVDFGAVRDKLRPEGGSTVVGTFGYMAPEQFQGRAMPASDVYAIGTTAIAMLTGREPEDLPHKGLTLDVRAALGARADPQLVRTLEAMLDPNPDTRASRIAPLLDDRTSAPPHARSRPAVEAAWQAQWQETWQREQQRVQARVSERMAEKQARWERKRARREARRGRRDHRHFGPPAVVVALIGLALTLAMAVVRVATFGIVPLVLGILSIFFGRRPMHRAATAVRHGGGVAIETMREARGRIAEAASGGDEVQVRVVEEKDAEHVRVGDDDAREDASEQERASRRERRS